ncbi:hypothetical protein JAAARDRAFT_206584 [Jaapia argillacea MUCL 33604]|uniref:histidine kinase n=1 Tax=Jaapia argillacea MUCL 33604 TaxID=933084 RepID=A0A067Q5F6_9AGAM|nr:hypothetical protein JAAARDRAFT_206584 [Jaapia argillacea MUCL 33604]
MPSSSPTLAVHRDDLERQLRFDEMNQRDTFTRFWRELVKRVTVASTGTPTDGLGDVSETSTSVPTFLAAQKQAGSEKDGGDWFVNEVVLTGEDSQHRDLGSDKATSRPSDSDSHSIHRGASGDSHQYQGGLCEWLRWRCWPVVYLFFDPKFEDAEREADFQNQCWYSSKALTFYAALYLVLNWVLFVTLFRPESRYEQIAYYGGLAFFTLPIPFMVAADLPNKYGPLFQIWFCIAVWYSGITEVIEMRQCDFFTDNHCHGKEFLAMMYYITALPAMMMFVVSRRFYNLIAQVITLVLLVALVLPNQGVFVRNILSFIVFSIFVQGLHYAREMTERRMYLLNAQLKVAYRAQQKAQIAESKASDAKRRFASYIFHEVRVPLNTAMLAYQNLRTSNAFKDEHLRHHNSVEIYALEASLTMMQQVLNDVLDLQKMDAGRFESSPRPFPLHRAINSIMGPIAVATSAKSLDLRVEFDERIDTVLTSYNASEGVWVIGDEIRLRQVLTNLASNAVKFTPEGKGEVMVRTKLLAPLPPDNAECVDEFPPSRDNPLINRLDGGQSTLVVRIEVEDSGPGIRPSDLVDNRLFQPFVQTGVGKKDGSGSGLGLAIVQQIVALSGGRLGVQSRNGAGAIFWVEFSYPMATMADVDAARNAHTITPTPPACLIPPKISDLDPERYASLPTPMDHHFVVPHRSESSATPTPPPLYVSKGTVALPPPQDIVFPALVELMSVLAPISTDEPLRILVVDDDALTRTLMARMLTKLGCVVETANDGQQCLDILLKPQLDGDPFRTYDLISLDNQMPVMTGEEAVRKLRSLGRTDLVVGCTGNALTEDQASYIEAGADYILTKPIMLRDLKPVLQIAFERRTQRGGA